MKKIILTTINAKWIHPSLALRLLKANLGPLEETCQIMEFALRQPLSEKTAPLLAAFASGDRPQILGISVSIWNHTATIELLEELEKSWSNTQVQKPIIVLGGPEVSHLSPEANIFKYADYIICGEGETPFRLLCEDILAGKNNILRVGAENPARPQYFIYNFSEDLNTTKTAYHLYTNEDLAKKLIYVESSRGCPFSCDFCLSA
ncbi:MAG: cobalamin-dependent protein, partial [Treponema sp.]|nr:cobalamin-dependent protein [Treponema sp.]